MTPQHSEGQEAMSLKERASKLAEVIEKNNIDWADTIESALLEVAREARSKAIEECQEVLKKSHQPQATERAYWINDVLKDVAQQVEALSQPPQRKGSEMENESLPEMCSKPPILEFEGFIIRPFDGWHLWMENPSGEGTTIRKAEFLGALVKLFDRNF